MKRKWDGLNCVYCGTSAATTDDEVFAQCFFHKPDAINEELPKVPACKACNGKKSNLDQYAATLLAFGARHASAIPHLKNIGMRRIEKNQALRREVAATVGRVQTPGERDSSMTFRVDYRKIVSLFEMIAKGLMWHERKVYLATDTKIDVMFLTQENAIGFANVIANWKWDKTSRNVWNGTVLYRGMFAGCASEGIVLDPQFSAWEITMLGGVHIAMPDPSRGICTAIQLLTGDSAAYVRGATPQPPSNT